MNLSPSFYPLQNEVSPAVEPHRNLYTPATYVVAIAGAAAAALSTLVNPVIGLFTAALVCGWAEIDGLCGTSHVGALTPLRVMDKAHRMWRRAILAYTLGGVATASIVGLTLGVLGAVARSLGLTPALAMWLFTAWALILALRELGLPSYALPQVPRQTDKMWAMRFGFVTGAGMWGSHIGLGFATVIRHGGIYAIAGCALFLDPLKTALLMATFWIGRTLPIWATPLLTSDERDGSIVMDMLLKRADAYRICAFAGLASMGAIAASLAWASA